MPLRRSSIIVLALMGLLVGAVGTGNAQERAPGAGKPPRCKKPPSSLPLPTSPPTSTTTPCRAVVKISNEDASSAEWQGTFEVDAQQTVPGNNCVSAWEGEFTIEVRENGTVFGDGTATATEPATCTAGFVGVPAATGASLTVEGGFTGRAFKLRFAASALEGAYEAGFHLLYYPGPPTIRVPLLAETTAAGVVNLYNDGPEELTGGGGQAWLIGSIILKQS